MNRSIAFRVLLALVGVAHLALGLIANIAPPEVLAAVAAKCYGAVIDVTPQTHHVIRIVGAFMLGIGVMAFLACRDPQRNQAIVFGIITVLLLRVLQRLVFAQEISTSFNVPSARVWAQIAFFLATAAALYILRPKPSVVAKT